MTQEAGPLTDFADGAVKGVDSYVVGVSAGQPFALSRRCRHLRADLAGGHVDAEGCLVCPWHEARYDTTTGRMVGGPQGFYAKVPGLGWAFKTLTAALPLKRGRASVRDGSVFVD